MFSILRSTSSSLIAAAVLVTEFDDAVSIKKLHRFAISAAEVRFGLLAFDGTIHYFRTSLDGIENIAAETFELARAVRQIANGGDPKAFRPSHMPGHLQMTDGAIAPFIAPRMKFDRAAEHFDRLIMVIDQYKRQAAVSYMKVRDTDTATIWKMEVTGMPPAVIPLMIGDIIHNLRSALDITICDIARSQGKTTSNLKFPFAENKEKLSSILDETIRKRLGDDVAEIILSLAPYKGGNEALRALHDFDVIDKHRLLLPSIIGTIARHSNEEHVVDILRTYHPEIDASELLFIGDKKEYVRLQSGDELALPKGKEPIDYYVTHSAHIDIFFPSSAPGFPGKPVVAVLGQLFKVTLDILKTFFAEFERADGAGAAE